MRTEDRSVSVLCGVRMNPPRPPAPAPPPPLSILSGRVNSDFPKIVQPLETETSCSSGFSPSALGRAYQNRGRVTRPRTRADRSWPRVQPEPPEKGASGGDVERVCYINALLKSSRPKWRRLIYGVLPMFEPVCQLE